MLIEVSERLNGSSRFSTGFQIYGIINKLGFWNQWSIQSQYFLFTAEDDLYPFLIMIPSKYVGSVRSNSSYLLFQFNLTRNARKQIRLKVSVQFWI